MCRTLAILPAAARSIIARWIPAVKSFCTCSPPAATNADPLCSALAALLLASHPLTTPPPRTLPRLAGQALELAVYLSVKQGDEAAFERNYAQVRPRKGRVCRPLVVAAQPAGGTACLLTFQACFHPAACSPPPFKLPTNFPPRTCLPLCSCGCTMPTPGPCCRPRIRRPRSPPSTCCACWCRWGPLNRQQGAGQLLSVLLEHACMAGRRVTGAIRHVSVRSCGAALGAGNPPAYRLMHSVPIAEPHRRVPHRAGGGAAASGGSTRGWAGAGPGRGAGDEQVADRWIGPQPGTVTAL